MADKFENPLSSEEWRMVANGAAGFIVHGKLELVYVRAEESLTDTETQFVEVRRALDWPAILAVANAALEDFDSRKITRRSTMQLRALRVFVQTGVMPSLEARADLEDELTTIIDALESYLPPE